MVEKETQERDINEMCDAKEKVIVGINDTKEWTKMELKNLINVREMKDKY